MDKEKLTNETLTILGVRRRISLEIRILPLGDINIPLYINNCIRFLFNNNGLNPVLIDQRKNIWEIDSYNADEFISLFVPAKRHIDLIGGIYPFSIIGEDNKKFTLYWSSPFGISKDIRNI